ncbi:hypothetical protein [Streptomyces sp. NPDC127084]|uniref:allene oxide cyclase barrel-like domain-containing protein n=1 Tax=Streptomyces sp. NPDC127084 TaxID=3347133 RepID=UPI003667FBB7
MSGERSSLRPLGLRDRRENRLEGAKDMKAGRYVSVGLLAIAGIFAAGSPAAADHGDEDSSKKVLRLKHVQEDSWRSGDGSEAGDRFGFTGSQYKKDGEPFGTYGGECTVLAVDDEDITHQCFVTSNTPRGQITIQGIHTEPVGEDAFPQDDAITGGTGAFAHASGFTRTDQVSPTTYITTYYLRR